MMKEMCIHSVVRLDATKSKGLLYGTVINEQWINPFKDIRNDDWALTRYWRLPVSNY